MKRLLEAMGRLLKSDDGPTAAEYALMLFLVFVVVLAAVQTFGTRNSTIFNKTAQSLSTV
jgi:pilus assembly protein Flp/PilA